MNTTNSEVSQRPALAIVPPLIGNPYEAWGPAHQEYEARTWPDRIAIDKAWDQAIRDDAIFNRRVRNVDEAWDQAIADAIAMDEGTPESFCRICNKSYRNGHSMLRCEPATQLELHRIRRARETGKSRNPSWWKPFKLPTWKPFNMKQKLPAIGGTTQSDTWLERAGGARASLPDTEDVRQYVKEFSEMVHLVERPAPKQKPARATKPSLTASSIPALRAHQTMVRRRMETAGVMERGGLVAKIEDYDRRIRNIISQSPLQRAA